MFSKLMRDDSLTASFARLLIASFVTVPLIPIVVPIFCPHLNAGRAATAMTLLILAAAAVFGILQLMVVRIKEGQQREVIRSMSDTLHDTMTALDIANASANGLHSVHKQMKLLKEQLSCMARICNQVGVFACDATGAIVKWNDTAEAVFGYDSESAVGRHISFLLATDLEADSMQEAIHKAVDCGSSEGNLKFRDQAKKPFSAAFILNKTMFDENYVVCGIRRIELGQIITKEQSVTVHQRIKELSDACDNVRELAYIFNKHAQANHEEIALPESTNLSSPPEADQIADRYYISTISNLLSQLSRTSGSLIKEFEQISNAVCDTTK